MRNLENPATSTALKKKIISYTLGCSLYKTNMALTAMLIIFFNFPTHHSVLIGTIQLYIFFSRIFLVFFNIKQVYYIPVTFEKCLFNPIKKLLFYEYYETKRMLSQMTATTHNV